MHVVGEKTHASSPILGPDGKPYLRNIERSANQGSLSAAYDDALRMPELADHFAGCNALSARAAASSAVRKHIREKVRHERYQNSYLSGMLQTAANYLMGTGPKLQMLMLGPNGKIDRKANREIEQDWMRWTKRIRLAEKLRTLVMAKKGDGESFAAMAYNPAVGEDTGIPLDLLTIECDQIEDLRIEAFNDRHGAGGIVFDEYENPVEYPVLEHHPGDNLWWINVYEKPQFVDRKFMCHLFRRDRPGQRRGVSEWLPAMPLFALYRRMTLATIGNIETAASLSAVLETEAENDTDGKTLSPWGEEDWFMSFPIARRMMMTLPTGAKLKQFLSAAPNSEYDSFTKALLREIARCTNMPFNIASGDSSSYNYASGRLDHQSFFLSNKVELTDIEYEVVERLFDRWIRIRAAKASGIAPEDIDVSLYTHQFVWDGLEHVDPQKEASAAQIRLASGTTTRGREYFKQGLDIDDMDERAAEELGFDTVKEYRQAIAANLFGTQNQALQKMQIAQGQQSQEQRPQVASGTRPGISAADMAFIEGFVNERIESLMELRS